MNTNEQLKVLETLSERFDRVVGEHLEAKNGLRARNLTTFQLNIGKKCNQSCRHCHVGGSPSRTEAMDRKTADACLEVICDVSEIETVDITGGAPEMNPNFTYLVKSAIELGKKVIDRCNLTILEEPGYEYLYDFLSSYNVEIVASLPHFRKDFTDRQRGPGVHEKSITALKKLNRLGYGRNRTLNLVYNPVGIYLSAPQKQLEREFKENLYKRHGIVFNSLFCINNMPIDGFFKALDGIKKLPHYMEMLRVSFNPQTLSDLMCRQQLSVSHDGYLYDCDFNQMLDMGPICHITEFDYERLMSRKIITANHCYGCTAGAGSSCGGEIASGQ